MPAGLDLPPDLIARLNGRAEVVDADPAADVDPAAAAEAGRLLAGMTSALTAELELCRRPLEAELTVCGFLGMVAQLAASGPDEDGSDEGGSEEGGSDGGGPDVDYPLDPAELDQLRVVLLTGVIMQAAQVGSVAALGLLRVLSVLGPAAVRELAAVQAERVAASGVTDPRWAPTVGRPALVRAWRYGDLWGSQSSVGLLFDYGRREHAVMTLIDHELGGGVKDCWVAEGRLASGVRDRVFDEMDSQPHAYAEDIDVRTAALALRDALSVEPCPVEDDQVEDVATHLDLVRSRTELLAALAGLPGQGTDDATAPPAASPGSGDILRIKVSLAGAKPPIWRRLEVPARFTLAQLHRVLQTAFDWNGSHLHVFERPEPAELRRYLHGAGNAAIPDRAERRTRVGLLLAEAGAELLYRYDLGDDWEHRIVLESRGPADPAAHYPRCLAGRRAAPPDDCGGMPGYDDLLEALADPDHPEHDELKEWIPAGFDPAQFRPGDLNAAFARIR